MAGTTPETAIRIMSRLKAGGIVRSARGKTIILDETKLRLLSEGHHRYGDIGKALPRDLMYVI
jgi:hypothetical protein